MLTIACCLVVWLGLTFGWLVAMHTYKPTCICSPGNFRRDTERCLCCTGWLNKNFIV